jgi:hypothetical protein
MVPLVILVSGTKRSGTSMWMQVFDAAGLRVVGERFPRDWSESALGQANKDGFYESILRDGIYHATNPHPKTGTYFRPLDCEGWVVKVFIPGVVRSEAAFIEGVVANVRAWREYEASVNRLWALEDEARREKAPGQPSPPRFPPALEWWVENFCLLRDIHRRQYPALLQTYDQVLADPETYVRRALDDIGAGDVDKALAAVKPENRTQRAATSDTVEPQIAAVFDDLYDAVADQREIDDVLMKHLDDNHQRLLPRLQQLRIEMARKAWEAGMRPPPPSILGVPD